MFNYIHDTNAMGLTELLKHMHSGRLISNQSYYSKVCDITSLHKLSSETLTEDDKSYNGLRNKRRRVMEQKNAPTKMFTCLTTSYHRVDGDIIDV